ncbi:MAG: GNAT family N-acetyltransferase [Ruminococcus sp.]|nr:GNAT family N-acetyltransferase [Ruminococcus sp.]
MSEIVFDTADKKDIDDLIRLRIAYMIDDFGSISEQEERCMREQLPDYFGRKLGSELIAFVARDGGRPVAAAYLFIMEKPASPFLPNGFDGEVLSVYTEPEYRGRGICTQLMKNLIGYGREHHLCRIDLFATDEGYPIYKKLGFADKVQKYTDMRLNFIK